MENIGNEEVTTELINAEQLRGITITQEERFERDRVSVLHNLLDGMVQQAQQFGATEFSANLNPKFDPALLVEVTKNLTELGYDVNSGKQKDQQLGEFLVLNISWALQPATEVVETAVEETIQQS